MINKEKTINPQWLYEIKKVVNFCPYFQLQQMTLEDLGWGSARLAIDLEERHLQPFGLVHGGVFASLMDAAGFWAVYSQLPESVGLTTVELKINYLASMISGRLIGLGSCIKLGRTIGLGDARIENEDGKLVAHGTTTVMVQEDLGIKGEEGRGIPKFL
ncbi:MAG: PaaI family thioesterase [Thermodesulfobacteriota bacterium]|nr:PaaI family thioesterase [Thermodesulfobacteriota bacterium]